MAGSTVGSGRDSTFLLERNIAWMFVCVRGVTGIRGPGR